MTYILGISAFYHDSAACLLRDGIIIAAAQEERFTRKKHDASFPRNAINYCLNEATITYSEVEYVVFYEKPFLKFERLLETYLALAPKGFLSFAQAMPIWIKEKLFQKLNLIRELKICISEDIDWEERLLFSQHHLSHAASAFYPSPFDSAAILTLDGVGEWTTTSVAIGKSNELEILKEIHFPHSLGLLYSAFTYYLGFKVNSGEYKVMGLAPYGKPIYADRIKENLISIADDGSFQLNMTFFEYATGLKMISRKFADLFGGPPRQPEAIITQREMDLAASIQKVTEEIICSISREIAFETQKNNLCLAGGVALNCVANGILLKQGLFENIWVQPAAGDAGGALGAALSAWHIHLKKPRQKTYPDAMRGAYLGPGFSQDQVRRELQSCNANQRELSDEKLIDEVTENLIAGKSVGWMQGRMEFGPRALGNRSILADPRSSDMQKRLNLSIKYRESFRPFAPSVLDEEVSDWFDIKVSSPYMTMVSELRNDRIFSLSEHEIRLSGFEKLGVPRSEVPAITHVDNTARIQTVHQETNPKFHALITNFFKKTGCPILINTSFNVRGEPIILSPKDAYRCFMGCGLDVLVVGNSILKKEDQPKELLADYKGMYELD